MTNLINPSISALKRVVFLTVVGTIDLGVTHV
jgi:hypothetical protein